MKKLLWILLILIILGLGFFYLVKNVEVPTSAGIWEACDFTEFYDQLSETNNIKWTKISMKCSSGTSLNFIKVEGTGMYNKVDIYAGDKKIFTGFPATFDAVSDIGITILYYNKKAQIIYWQERGGDVCDAYLDIFVYDTYHQRYILTGKSTTLEYDTISLTNQTGTVTIMSPIPLQTEEPVTVSFDGLKATYNGVEQYLYKLPAQQQFTYGGCGEHSPYSLGQAHFDMETLTVFIKDNYKNIVYDIYNLSTPKSIENY